MGAEPRGGASNEQGPGCGAGAPTDRALLESHQMLQALSRAQAKFIADGNPRETFDDLLQELLRLTESQYGFIGEVFEDARGRPYLKAHAITNISWNPEVEAFFQRAAPSGLEFRRLDSLFGAVMTTGRPVISNDPGADPRRGGLPPGHPRLDTFLGLPFFQRGRMNGMVGVANRPSGYDESMVRRLEPFLATCAALTESYRNDRRRQQAERSLRESEERLQVTITGAEVGTWHWDVATKTQIWSDQCRRLLGASPDEPASYERFLELIHPEDRVRVRDGVAQTLGTGAALPSEYRIRLPDGAVRWLASRGRAFFEEGRPVRLEGVIFDITKSKRTEEALIESERKFRTLFDTALDAIVVVRGMTIVDCNPRAEQLFGGTRAQIIGQTPARFSAFVQLDGRDSPAVALDVVSRALRGEPQFLEWKGHRLDGTPFDCEVSLNPLELHGEPHVQAIIHDITARKQLEEQLRQSQKMEAIGQLAGGVAHDFNNLLTVVQGNVGLLRDAEDLAPYLLECVGEIEAAAERAANLTRQLLAFSRRQAIKLKPVNLNQVIGNLTRMLQRIVGEHIRFESRFAAALPLVQADAGMIEQVLLNLTVNSRDAMPVGGQLFVETEAVTLPRSTGTFDPDATDGPCVRLTVTDTGRGIAAADLPRIFDPFFTTKDIGQGTGLGLATVYGIVKQHRGVIRVTSEVGRGTTFQIFLPAFTGPTTDDEPGARAAVRAGFETILVVEDEARVRRLVRRVLEGHGYDVLEAGSGPEALDVWEAHGAAVALLLTDLVMPDKMSGIELARTLRNKSPRLRVLYTSGYSRDVVGEESAPLDGARFLPKPYAPEQLLRMVRSCLDE